MCHIAVNILDLGQALLGHLDQFGPRPVLGELRGALVLRRRVLIMVPVLLKREEGRGRERESNSVRTEYW